MTSMSLNWARNCFQAGGGFSDSSSLFPCCSSRAHAFLQRARAYARGQSTQDELDRHLISIYWGFIHGPCVSLMGVSTASQIAQPRLSVDLKAHSHGKAFRAKA